MRKINELKNINMQSRFKLILLFVFLSMLSVFIVQYYWLISFYEDQSSRMEVDILNAMKNADYKEIYWRLSVPSQDSLQTKITSEIRQTGQTDYPALDITILYDADEMLRYFQKDLHKSLGDIKAVDFSTYSNLLQIELTEKGIMLETFTEMLDLSNNEVLKRIPADSIGIDRSEYKAYLYPFDIEGNYAYRLNVKQPRLFVLKQMAGLLGTSLLMVLFIFFSYIYLVRTIFRQKSLDEIKSDFVNNMTHELKTPISVAYAANDALLNYGIIDDPRKRTEYLNVSREQLMHLNSLVEQILTMSVEERKNLKLSLETIDLKNLFLHMESQYLLNVSKPISFQINVEPDNLTVKADKVHFHNVISNLIENSIKYSEDNVNIKLKAFEKNGNVIISVEDDGLGIPTASIPKLFDRFYRVPTGNIYQVKGYGLGLYYVKTIIDKHGWKIEVESKEGKGTTFVLYT